MNNFPDSLLDQIRGAISISDVVGQYVVYDKTKSKSGDMWGCCPFHGEKSPSFHADDRKGVYHCFGCGAHGDHFKFVEEHLGESFPTSVRIVAEMAGVTLPEDQQREIPERKAPPKQEPAPEKAPDYAKLETVEEYDYTDGDGNLVYQVCRRQWRLPDGGWRLGKKGKPDKTFSQKRPLGNGEWVWGLSGGEYMRRPGDTDWRAYNEKWFKEGWERREFELEPLQHGLYRLQQVEIAASEGRHILVVEGERKVHAAERLGFAATCNSGGAGKFPDHLLHVFKGAFVTIVVDNDETGLRHGDFVARKLRSVAAGARVLVLPRLGPGQDIVDWDGTREELLALIDATPLWRPTFLPPPSAFGGTTLHNLATSKIVYDWLIKGLIERNGVFIVAGEKQAGKSFFTMDLGMRVARGIDYADRKVKQGLVIYMACEDGRGTQMRAEGYRRENNIPDTEEVPFIVMDRNFSLMSDEVIDKFIAECKVWAERFETQLELIIIDTFSMATEGLDEIQSGEVGKVLGRVNRIAAATGSAVCLVHHMNAEGKRVRGHSSLTANVSQVIEIRQMTEFQTGANRHLPVKKIRDSEGRPVRQAVLEKNKNGQNEIKWRFVLRKIDLGLDDDGFEISTCVLDRPASEVSEEAQQRSKLHPDQKLVLDALRACLEDHPIDMPRGVRVGPSVRHAVSEKDFVARVRKVWSFKASETEVEARNKELAAALRRITTSLQNSGHIGRDNDHHVLWDLGKGDRYRDPPPPAVDISGLENFDAPF